MQSQTLEQLTPSAAQAILANLPERIRTAFIDRAISGVVIFWVDRMSLRSILDTWILTLKI
jgi:hypothetical protein